MRKKKIAILCCIMVYAVLFAAACGKGEPEEKNGEMGEEYVEGSDYQAFFGSGSMPVVQRVGKGYYILVSEQLFYYDDSLEQAVPVCGRADCEHIGESCNASMSDVYEINYYNHRFYYIAPEGDNQEKWFLCYLSEDGEQREKVMQIATVNQEDRGISFELCVHRGYAYFSVRKMTSLKKRKAVVQKISLDEKVECSEVMCMEGYGASVEKLTAYGNTLVVVGCYADSAGADFQEHTSFIDIRNDSVRQDVLFHPGRELIFIHKNRENVYYYDSRKLYRKNMDTGETEEIKTDSDVFMQCSEEGGYFYICNEGQCHETGDYHDYRLDVYDMDGKRVGRIPLEEMMEWEYGDETACFTFSFDNETETYSVKMYDKHRRSEEGEEWKEILLTGGASDGSSTDISE